MHNADINTKFNRDNGVHHRINNNYSHQYRIVIHSSHNSLPNDQRCGMQLAIAPRVDNYAIRVFNLPRHCINVKDRMISPQNCTSLASQTLLRKNRERVWSNGSIVRVSARLLLCANQIQVQSHMTTWNSIIARLRRGADVSRFDDRTQACTCRLKSSKNTSSDFVSHRRNVPEWERTFRQAELANRRLKLPFIVVLCKARASFQLSCSVMDGREPYVMSKSYSLSQISSKSRYYFQKEGDPRCYVVNGMLISGSILFNAHQVCNNFMTSRIPLQREQQTRLTRPFLDFFVGGSGLRDQSKTQE